MPKVSLSEDERKARRQESARKYRENNREKCVAASIASRNKNIEKHRSVQKTYRDRNAARIAVVSKEYRAEKREELNAKSRQWQIENDERFKSYQANYRKENVVRERARSDAWRQKHKEREQFRKKASAILHRERRRVGEINRRAAKMRSGEGLSKEIVERLLLLQQGKCACCNCELHESGFHLDHIQPLSKGGPHSDSNIQLLCPRCNLSKSAKDPIQFMQQNGFLL